MKPKRESLPGTLAVLGLAVAAAYLGPDHDHLHPSRSRAISDEAAEPDDAFEPGRGRHAVSPRGIPAKGWKDILWRTYEQLNEDRLLAVAAGVVFYGLLALFRPLLRWSHHMHSSPTPRRSTITWPSSAGFFQKGRFQSSKTR